MASKDDHIAMITAVAQAMGPDLCNEVAFVGGCTTALLVTDTYSQGQVRHTDDVDLIVHVISMSGWLSLVSRLRSMGFTEPGGTADDPICAMKLGLLRVDFMPDDEEILGFTNKWYRDAFQKAKPYFLSAELTIRLIPPTYFIATKLEAYLQRGNDDPIGSRDIEDILTLIDGRTELLEELLDAPAALKTYVSEQMATLCEHGDFSYAVQAATNNDASREDALFERIKLIISYGTAV